MLCKETYAKKSLQRKLCTRTVVTVDENQEPARAPGPADAVHDRHRGDRVLDTGALRALAHPLRVKIYDTLRQYGAQTASSLAERLGESSGSTSYHLRSLAAHDLIREVDRGTARERWWEATPGPVALGDPASTRTPAGRAASQLVVSELLRNRHEQLVEYVTSRAEREEESWKDAGLVSTATARMTAEQVRDLSARIMTLIDEAVDAYRHQTGEGVRPVTIGAEVFPLPDIGGTS